MSQAYDFTGLTPSQHALLTFQGWHVGDRMQVQPTTRTVRKLIERGLVIPHARQVPFAGRMTMEVTEYEVPLPVHLAWCMRCGERARRRPGQGATS